MFGWLKKLFTASPAAAPAATAGSETASSADEPPLAVMDVVDQFLRQNPQRSPLATLALIQAGATRLRDDRELLEACDRIAAHGYQYPLSPTVQREVPEGRLLAFLRWQRANGAGKQDYQTEHAVRDLIQRFLQHRSG